MICSNCWQINRLCKCAARKGKARKESRVRHHVLGDNKLVPLGCTGKLPNTMETAQSRRSTGGSPGSSKVTVPFYAPPTYCKKTSAEIISEARAAIVKGATSMTDMSVGNTRVTAAIRPVNTKRPFTPRERQRTLFGGSNRSSWRPPSSFSLGYLQFQETDGLSTTPPHIRKLNPLPFSPSSSLNSSLDSSGSSAEQASWRAQLAGEGGEGEGVRKCSVTTPAQDILSLYGNSASTRLKLPSIGSSGNFASRRNQFRAAASLDNLPEELEGEENESVGMGGNNNQHREAPPPRKAYSSPVQRTRTIEINLDEECFADIDRKDHYSPTPNKRSLAADVLSSDKTSKADKLKKGDEVIKKYKSEAWADRRNSSANSKKIKPNESTALAKDEKDTKNTTVITTETFQKSSAIEVKEENRESKPSQGLNSVLIGSEIKPSLLAGLSPEVVKNAFGLEVEYLAPVTGKETGQDSDANQKTVRKTPAHKPNSGRNRSIENTHTEKSTVKSSSYDSNSLLRPEKPIQATLPVSPDTMYLSNAKESIIRQELRPTSQDSLKDEILTENLDTVNTLVSSTLKSNAWISDKSRKKPDNYKPARPFSSGKKKASTTLEDNKGVSVAEDPILAPIHRAMQQGYATREPKSGIQLVGDSEVNGQRGNFGAPVVVEEKQDPIQLALETLTELSQRNGNDIEVILALSKLYKALESEQAIGTNVHNSKLKNQVLKTLYKFVERSNETLLLQIARIILAFRVTGSNLSGVCKLVFKVSRCDKNDKLFLEDNILELFVEALGSASPLEDAEACVYGYGALKFLTMNNVLLSRVLGLGTLELMVLHMKIVNAARSEGSRIPEQTSHALFQLTGALRNTAGEEEMFPHFVSTGAVTELCRAMDLFSSDLDVISNVSRTLSIISTHDDCSTAIVEYENSFKLFVKLFQKYPGRQDIVVRLGYALGNLMAKSDVARTKFYNEEGAVSSMLNLLTIYLEKDLKMQDIESHNQNISSDAGSNGSVEDVIVKMIRILANMSINPAVGSSLAGASPSVYYNNSPQTEEAEDGDYLEANKVNKNGGRFLDVLLTVLRRKSANESEELTHSVLSTLNNLSYYPTCNDGAFGERQLEIAQVLGSMLNSEHKECLVESMRVFGNLTRSQDVRDYLLESGVFLQLLKFLDTEDRDLLCTSAGILVNMMADWDKRVALKEGHGISRLTKVLVKFGEGEWHLATLICQALWNYCIESTNLHAAFGVEETNELLGVLADYLDEERLFGVVEGTEVNEALASSPNYQLWEEFAGVATNLLEKIDTFLDSLEPLEMITLTNDDTANTKLEVMSSTMAASGPETKTE